MHVVVRRQIHVVFFVLFKINISLFHKIFRWSKVVCALQGYDIVMCFIRRRRSKTLCYIFGIDVEALLEVERAGLTTTEDLQSDKRRRRKKQDVTQL